MEGAWRVYDPGERWRGGPAHQIRAVLATAEHTAVGYRLPVLELLRTEDEEQAVGHLGPDLLGPDWDPDTALRNLLADPGRRIGEALLDQRNLAGIGNVYMCELCFLARATPWLPVGELSLPRRDPAGQHGQTAPGGQPRPPHADHDRGDRGHVPQPHAGASLRLRPGRPALPALPHAHPRGGPRRPPHLLVSALPVRAHRLRSVPRGGRHRRTSVPPRQCARRHAARG